MDFGSPPSPGGAPSGPEGLVGQQEQKQPTDGESQNRAFAMLIRSIHTSLDDLARQYPEMQESAGKAKKALTDGMVQKMSKGQSQGESAQTPKTVG